MRDLDPGSTPSHLVPVHTFDHSGEAAFCLSALAPSSLGSSVFSVMRTAVAVGTIAASSFAPLLPCEAVAPPAAPEVRQVADTSEAPALPSAVQRSLAAIRRSMDEVSIEGGVTHPAQSLLDSHLAAFGEAGLETAVKSTGSARGADLLRVLGRTDGLSESLRTALVVWGLASPSVDVRDAAVQAVENWGDVKLTAQLVDHDEPVAWLRSYAAAVVRDLRA